VTTVDPPDAPAVATLLLVLLPLPLPEWTVTELPGPVV